MCGYGSVTITYHLPTCAHKINLIWKNKLGRQSLLNFWEKNFLHIHLGQTGTFKCIFYTLCSLKNLQKSYKTKLVDTNNINTSSLSLLLDNAKNNYSENLHN